MFRFSVVDHHQKRMHVALHSKLNRMLEYIKRSCWSVLKAEKLLNLWIRRYARKCSLNSCKVWLFIAVHSTFLPGRFVKAESWKLKGEYWSLLKAEKLQNLGIRHHARNCSLNSCKVWLFIAVHSTFLPGRFVNLFGTR